jgi:NTP pyrophosphatase (non-canonical NTP hydrolase)
VINVTDLTNMGYIDAMNADKDPLKEYSDWVESKILTSGHERLVENTLGLVGESGEVAEKVKKLIRDKHKFTAEEIASELGDVLFYNVAIASIFGFTLGDIIRMNMEKLNSRQERGVLQGSGDNR